MGKNKTRLGNIVVAASASCCYAHFTYPQYSAGKAAVWKFVRVAAPVPKTKDIIRINSTLPGFVAASLAPRGMVAAADGYMTPITIIMAGLNKILDNEKLISQSLECSVEIVVVAPEPEYLNGEISRLASFPYEPGFQAIHNQPSGLPNYVG